MNQQFGKKIDREMKLKIKYKWELAKIFKKGEPLTIKPTMRCNLNCPYCGASLEKGRLPKYKEKDYLFWIDKIQQINKKKKINQIGISGGEPGIYKNLHKIVNWLTDNGYVVLILTNLTRINEFTEINKSWRVRFIATYHEVADLGQWLLNYLALEGKFHIVKRELREKDSLLPKKILGSEVKELFNESPDEYGRQVAPDGTEYFSCKQISAGGE